MPRITASNLCVGYEGRTVAKDINFTVEPGDYLAILGKNGAGKTTLLKTLLGLQPPLRGHVDFNGAASKGQVGYLPQGLEIQSDFPAKVREIVMSGFVAKSGLRPFYSAAEHAFAQDVMDRLGMGELMRQRFSRLSGGQQRRVLLARALCAAECLLILDEPGAGLDPVATAELYRLLSQINREQVVTVIVVTHDTAAALAWADHILYLGEDGAVFSTKDAFAQSAAAKVWLGDECDE